MQQPAEPLPVPRYGSFEEYEAGFDGIDICTLDFEDGKQRTNLPSQSSGTLTLVIRLSLSWGSLLWKGLVGHPGSDSSTIRPRLTPVMLQVFL